LLAQDIEAINLIESPSLNVISEFGPGTGTTTHPR